MWNMWIVIFSSPWRSFYILVKTSTTLKETSVLEKKYRHKDDLGLKKYEIKSSEQRVWLTKY